MPRPRDQRLYFELQGKLTQQEVDYNNMHQHHTIVRAPQGKVTKISNDQYHDSMNIDEVEPVARQRAVVAQDYKPVNEQQPSRKASEPKRNGDAPLPSKSATQIRTNNLPPLPTEPPRVVSTNEAEAARANLRREAPIQNPSVNLLDSMLDDDIKEHIIDKFETSVAERVKLRKAKGKSSGVGKAKRGTKAKTKQRSAPVRTSTDEIVPERLDTGKRIGRMQRYYEKGR